MFTHSGLRKTERESSSAWLEIARGSSEHFSYLFKGEWIRFNVNGEQISNISNLSFVEIPSHRVSSNEINTLLEEVTRRLCRLLGSPMT